MPAYLIADVEVTDPKLFAEYRELVEPTVNAFGGRYIARGGETQLLEGDRAPNRTVIIEFDSIEQARAWHDSDEYAPAKDMRFRSANSHVIIVEGV